MAQPLPRVVKQPGGPNEYLAYLTRPEMRHLRANPAAPHNERLPDTGPLNTFNGVPLFWEADMADAMGNPDGASGSGHPDHGISGVVGSSGASYDSWGDMMASQPTSDPIGNPGDDARASEGGGEPQPANTGTRDTGTGTGTGTENGTGNGTGGGDSGPSDAELLAQRIADAMGAINSLFGNRQGVYDRLRDSSYALSESGIADAYQRAARKLGFQMLRQGVDTGQIDIDLRADLSKLKNDSLADAMRHAQGLAEGLRAKDSAKKSGLMSQALTGNLTPGQVGGMSGTLSAGVPQSWGGIADIAWNIPSGFAPGGGGGFMPNWKDMGNATPYFGASS